MTFETLRNAFALFGLACAIYIVVQHVRPVVKKSWMSAKRPFRPVAQSEEVYLGEAWAPEPVEKKR